MTADIKPGLVHRQTLRVTPALTVPALAASFAGLDDMPPVFATGFMVAFMEWACIEALRPYLDPGERTVGMQVDMTHVAATPPGMEVTAVVELVAVDGRVLTFKVACHDEAGPIGEGLHKRAIIGLEGFLQRLERKVAMVTG
jgi:fluoroacetyl-CoA thioesterase